MEHTILSLKNIYKLLITNDFPMYSQSVIAEKNRKGLTLQRFWQAHIADELRSLPIGQMIWRSVGKRNRYFSNLCNRRLEQRLTCEYAREIAQCVTDEVVLAQIERYITFLTVKAYDHTILMQRINVLLQQCAASDPYLLPSIEEHLRSNLALCTDLCGTRADDLFRASYLLTLLTIYASAGDEMHQLLKLQQEDISMESLWQRHQNKYLNTGKNPEYLTAHTSYLQDNPLPSHRFFGREEELYDLQEMAISNRKCLISGIGGIGKTELLRQLLYLCVKECLVDRIAVVPYAGSLTESFLRAFPNYRHEDPDSDITMLMNMLEKQVQQGNRLLILIDNMDQRANEPELLSRLLELPCSVLITSRCNELEGFEVYPIEEPSVAMSCLIFRANFEGPLSNKDHSALKELLQERAMRHPLTLRLMARAAASNRWSVTYLAEQVRSNLPNIAWAEQNRMISLGEIYDHLYPILRLSEEYQDVVELFTLLPRGSYSLEFLKTYFPLQFEKKLPQLVKEGWLDEDHNGYFMHPLSAQSLRRKTLTEKKILPLFALVRDALPRCSFFSYVLKGEKETLADILIHGAKYLKGRISREYLIDILRAIGMQVLSKNAIEQYRELLKNLYKRCKDPNDEVHILYNTVLCRWLIDGDSAQMMQLYRAQLKQRTVPDVIFWDYCLALSDYCISDETELCAEALRPIFDEEVTVDHRAQGYLMMVNMHYQLGNGQEALRWAQEAVSYIEEHPECSQDQKFEILHIYGVHSDRYEKNEETDACLRKLSAMLQSGGTPMQHIKLNCLKLQRTSILGSMEEIQNLYDETLQWMEEYNGKSSNYHVLLVNYGRMLQSYKHFEQALEKFQTAAAYFEKYEHYRFFLAVTMNNIASLYFEMGDVDTSLLWANKGLRLAKEFGGESLGACLHLIAKCYAKLDQTEQEYEALTQAYPLLKECYGEEYIKTQECKNRIEQIDALKKGE